MIKCTSFKKFENGFLQGFADIEAELEGFPILLRRCKVFKKEDNFWVNMPDHEYTNKEGIKAYAKDVKFISFEDSKEFSALTKEAVLTYIKANPSSDEKQEIKKDFFEDIEKGMF
jgi:hypothetical protein